MGISLEIKDCSLMAKLEVDEHNMCLLKTILSDGPHYVLVESSGITEDNAKNIKELRGVNYKNFSDSLEDLLCKLVPMGDDPVVYYCGTTSKKVKNYFNILISDNAIKREEGESVIVNIGSNVEPDEYEIDVSEAKVVLHDHDHYYYIFNFRRGVELQ